MAQNVVNSANGNPWIKLAGIAVGIVIVAGAVVVATLSSNSNSGQNTPTPGKLLQQPSPEPELTPATGGAGALSGGGTDDPTRKHHAWAKYLGGAEKQDLVPLPKTVHDAYHSGLDKILPRQKGTSYYQSLKGEARIQMYRDLAAYTKAFDQKYGTKLFEAMLKNGFTEQ